ncbi:phosphotransferase, partial [Streptomyces sp. SID7982]|nr:phosphotransferase [Streptomyces sp. SID7982]
DWSFLETAMRDELADEKIWIDSAELTVTETVDAILSATGLMPGRP